MHGDPYHNGKDSDGNPNSTGGAGGESPGTTADATQQEEQGRRRSEVAERGSSPPASTLALCTSLLFTGQQGSLQGSAAVSEVGMGGSTTERPRSSSSQLLGNENSSRSCSRDGEWDSACLNELPTRAQHKGGGEEEAEEEEGLPGADDDPHARTPCALPITEALLEAKRTKNGSGKRVRLTTSLFARIFAFQQRLPLMGLVRGALSPSARYASEALRGGYSLGGNSRIHLRKSEDGGERGSVERHVELFSSRLPEGLHLMRWWLQREPRLPIVLRASSLQGHVVVGRGAFDSIAGLDLSGCSSLLGFEMELPLESLRYVVLNGCTKVLFLPRLHGAVNLRKLVLRESAVLDLGGLHACPLLEEVDLTWCKSTTNVNGLSSLKHLQRLFAAHSGLVDLSGLAGCSALRELVLSDCTELSNITPLAQCQELRKLDLTNTSVANVAPLRECKRLEALDIIDCNLLRESHEIPSLISLFAQRSGITRVVTKHRHASLAVACFNDCRQLDSLSFLAGAQSLRKLTATFTPISNVNGLGACGCLEEIDLSSCLFLRDVDGLSYAPSLQRVHLNFSGVASIAGLSTCFELQVVSVSSCKNLTDLSPLNGLPKLRTLSCRLTPVREIVRHCRSLTSVDLTACKDLKDLSPLAAESPELQKLEASRSGVEDVSFLPRMTALKAAYFFDCPIQDTSFLVAFPHN